MRRLTTTAAVLALLATVAPACAAEGAFAYDEATGKFGFSQNEPSAKAAEDAAVKGCTADKCKVVFRFGPKECGAIAMTEDGKIWGGAKRPRREAAELAALQNCQKRTSGQCKIRGAECNK